MRSLVALAATATIGLAFAPVATASPPLSMSTAWQALYKEQRKEFSGRYTYDDDGAPPTRFRWASCKRKSPRKINCSYTAFFAPDGWTDGGSACTRWVELKLAPGAYRPTVKVYWPRQQCTALTSSW